MPPLPEWRVQRGWPMPAKAERQPEQALEALAVDATEAARICGVSRAMWWKLDRSGRCPQPVRVGRLKRWRVEELRAWLAMGCPPRSKMQASHYRRDKSRELDRLSKQSFI